MLSNSFYFDPIFYLLLKLPFVKFEFLSFCVFILFCFLMDFGAVSWRGKREWVCGDWGGGIKLGGEEGWKRRIFLKCRACCWVVILNFTCVHGTVFVWRYLWTGFSGVVSVTVKFLLWEVVQYCMVPSMTCCMWLKYIPWHVAHNWSTLCGLFYILKYPLWLVLRNWRTVLWLVLHNWSTLCGLLYITEVHAVACFT